MRFIATFFFLFFCSWTFGQDVYHTELLEFLNENYQLENSTYLLQDTENSNYGSSFDYGPVQISSSAETNQSFSLVINCITNVPSTNAWESGMGNTSRSDVAAGDIVLVTFWAKRNSASANIFMFAEDNSTFEKEFYHSSEFSPDWSQYFLAFEASKNYPTGTLNVGFHFGAQVQDVDIAGMTALNFGNSISIDDVPNTYSAANYGGHEADAAWRALAASRIESLRKANLNVQVVDQNSVAVEGADVRIEMQEHDFGFGSALVSCRFPGNPCYNPIYVEKTTNLDGRGHGFNVAVTENALKWDGWEEEWIASPEQTVSAIEWMHEQGMEVRGHTLFWPSWDLMPDDMGNNATNYSYLLNRIDERINTMINHPVLGDLITDWDVLNEITTNSDLQNTFENYSEYEEGIDVYKYIFQEVKAANPEMPIYVNDYVVLSGAGSSNTVINRYKDLLNQLDAAEVPFDGIGFQCHIGSVPTSIYKLQQVWDEYYQRYNVPLKVTEYDVNPVVSEEVAANYMADFLTMTFSHPAMEAFLMWGFWDGNHWKDNAPMYDFDWNLKPSGQVFIDKVFNEWWTEESSTTDQGGVASFRPFKGTHKVIVSKDGKEFEAEIMMDANLDYVFMVDLSVSTEDLFEQQFNIYPNPMDTGSFKIDLPTGLDQVDLQIYSTEGKLVMRQQDYQSETNIPFEFESGVYFLHIITDEKTVIKQLLVQ